MTSTGQYEDKMTENQKVQSGADMAAGSEFVDLGGFLENRNILNTETILRMQMKESIYLSSNGQATNQV